MTYSATGTYTPAAGALTAAAGQTIQSAVWNAVFGDLSTALTQVMQQLVSTPSVQRNVAFGNGGFEVWQRGAGSAAAIAVAASTAAYTADRWYLNTGVNQASTVSAVAGLTNGSNLAAKVQRNAAQTGTTQMTFGYPLDTESVLLLKGQKVNISFTAKAGLNFSPTSGTLSVYVNVGTGTPVKVTVGYTGSAGLITSTVALTSTATAYSVVGTVAAATNIAQAELGFAWTPVGTAGADDSFTIDDVQVEVQNSASTYTSTTFDRTPFGICLNDCRAHFNKTYQTNTAPGTVSIYAGALQLISAAAARCGMYWSLPMPMRTTPTYTTFNATTGASGGNWVDITAATTLAVTATATSINGIFFYSATAAATDHLIAIHAQADAGI